MRRRIAALVLAAALTSPVAVAASACCGSSSAASNASNSGSCGGSTSIPSCSPGAENKNAFGRISVQQAGPQQAVTWGVYPVTSFGIMTVQIAIDGVNVLGPYTRDYPQHGSFTTKSNQLASGATFYISGTWTPAGDTENKQGFYFTCTLA